MSSLQLHIGIIIRRAEVNPGEQPSRLCAPHVDELIRGPCDAIPYHFQYTRQRKHVYGSACLSIYSFSHSFWLVCVANEDIFRETLY